MSTSEGLRIKLKKRLKPVVTRRRIDSNVDIEPVTYRRNRVNDNSNVKYKDGEVSSKMDAINHRNPRVYKEKQFHSDFDRKQTNSYKKDDRERGRPFSHTGLDDFIKEKKSERTPRRKYPIRGSENSGMFEEKSYGFRAVGDRMKFRNKNVDGKMSGTRDRNEGEDGFTYRRFNSNRRMDTRNDNVARNSDAKTRHNDESLANRSIKMPRQKKGSDEESVITDEKYNRSGIASVNARLKKKKLDGSVSSTRCMDGSRGEFTKKNSNTRYMDGSRDEFTKKNSNGKFNSNKKTDQRETGNRLFTRNSDVQNKHLAGSLVSSGKKTLRWKKGSESDDGSTEVLPKKRKRIIRIDPHDISNKRIDDSISSQVVTKAVENIEVSQNAQFRAIKPSSEILSFVEDNLLGRRRLIEFRRAGYNIDISAPLDNIPLSTSSERERMEENVFRNKLEFFAAAKVSSSLPPPDLPEIAFAGRSNVGKSSLLNSLTRQWGVVRTSDKPGLTQSINFFNLASKLCLVDLPGYGFAYAKEEVKDAWEELVKEYVSTRAGLKRVCLLIDTKWGMKPRDYELINLMEGSETQYQIVLTKTDLVFPIDVARRAMQIQETLKKNKSAVKPVMMVSSKTGAGIRSLRTVLAKVARFAKL